MCHSRHARHTRHATRERPRDVPPDHPAGPTRAGDADRERAAEKLRVHAGAGRLDADELERRLETVLTATYLSELDAALADLPRLRSRERPRSARDARIAGPGVPRIAILLAAVAALLLVTMLTGLWALWWLMWPIAMLTHPVGRGRRHRRPASRAVSA